MKPSIRRLAPLLAAGILAPFALGAHATDTVIRPAWTPPLSLAGGGAEPSIRVANDGRMAAYISAPTGAGSNFWTVAEKVNKDGTHVFVGSAPQQPDLGTGGGDSEISVSSVPDPTTGCDTIAYSGLHNIDALNNFTVARSTDCGKTFGLTNLYGTQNTTTDRQWQTFDGKLTNHLIYHLVGSGQIAVSTSYDGGQTYISDGASNVNGVIDPTHAYTMPNAKIGNIVTDYSAPVGNSRYPISNDPIHTLYAVFAGSRDAQEAGQGLTVDLAGSYDHMDSIYVGKSTDGGLTWTDTTVYQTGAAERRELDLDFPVIAVDKRGHLYTAWTDGWHIFYSTSVDHGATWSKAYTVNASDHAGPKPTHGSANLFPWIVAGGKGNVDIVWYHGAGGNTSGYRNVGTKDGSPAGGTFWTVAMAQLSSADTTRAKVPTPHVVSYSNAVTPILHAGSVCNNGTLCDVPGTSSTGDRTLLDFFQVAVDKQGRANIAYVVDYEHAGRATTTYTRQNSGVSLWTGAPIARLAFHFDPDA